MTMTELPTPARRAGRLRGRPLLYRSYAQELALFNTRRQAGVGRGHHRRGASCCRSCSPTPCCRPSRSASPSPSARSGSTSSPGWPDRSPSATRSSSASAPTRRPRSPATPTAGRSASASPTSWSGCPRPALVAASPGCWSHRWPPGCAGSTWPSSRSAWSSSASTSSGSGATLTGGAGVGREACRARAVRLRVQSQTATPSRPDQNFYLLMLVLLLVFALGARNLARSRVGRAFAAVRDRDMAAEMMGDQPPADQDGGVRHLVVLRRVRRRPHLLGDRLLRAEHVLAAALGAVHRDGADRGSRARSAARSWARSFISLLPTLTRELPAYVPFISAQVTDTPNVFQLESILYGLLIVGLLAVRAARALRHLGPDPQLLEGLAVQLLSGRSNKGECCEVRKTGVLAGGTRTDGRRLSWRRRGDDDGGAIDAPGVSATTRVRRR